MKPKEEIVIKDDWDPDKYRDELCEWAWKRSGAKTLKELIDYTRENVNKYSLNDVILAGGG